MRPEADLVFGAFRLDSAGRQLWRGTTAVPLRPKLVAALQYLVEHPGRLITREELLRAVWSRTHVDETLLRGTMRELRAALGDDAEAPRFIETIPHQGYRFLADVRRESTPREAAVAATPGEAPPYGLIERERERAHLGRCLDRALDRQRQVVFVTGEPGIGKTSLVDAFVDALPNRHGVLVGRGQCVEQYGVGEAYLPVLEAIRQMCRSRVGKRVMATLQQHAPTWLVQLPALLTDSELDGLQRKTQGAGRDRMLREMCEALEVLSVEMPVALVFEDLHWSDHSTLDLMGMLARRREPARLLVVGTYRPADLIVSGHPLRALEQELHGRGLCEEVPLAFLSEPAIGEYLADRFEVAREDAAFRSLAHTIHRRTDGNPLFMVTVADDLFGHGAIACDGGVWRVVGDVEHLGAGVPEGLKQLIDRQLERLPAEDQRLLEAASVAGRTFSAAAAAASLDRASDEVDDQCARLAGRGVFIEESSGGAYAFLHDLYQRVLYDRLSTSRRSRVHKRIAEFEVQASADHVRERAAELAVHFERGGDAASAIDHLKQAAGNALSRHALQEAIDLLRHALDLLATLPPSSARNESELALQMLLSTPLVMAKGYSAPEAAAAVARARELSQQMEQSPALLPALLGMARLHFTRAELHDAAALGEQCVILSQHAPDPLPLITDSVMTYLRYFRAELELACTHSDRAAAAYDVARHGSIALAYGDDPGVLCTAFGAWALWRLGYAEQARTKLAAALELARRLEIPYCVAMALDVSTLVHLFMRDVAAATVTLDELETLAAQHGFPLFHAHGLGLRGWLMVQRGGDDSAAAALLEAALANCDRIGFQLGTPSFRADLAEALAAGGQMTRARGVVDEAIAVSGRTGELLDLMKALTVKGDLCVAGSAEVDAAACFEEAMALARKQAAKSMELRAATHLARLRQGQGNVAEARALISDVYGWFTEGFDTPDLRDARALIETLDRPVPRARPRVHRSTAAT
jgi:DNA-binding winged helix-turn-helix (wHTH) protein/tetratricopeptide (TPR) repeat protein